MSQENGATTGDLADGAGRYGRIAPVDYPPPVEVLVHVLDAAGLTRVGWR